MILKIRVFSIVAHLKFLAIKGKNYINDELIDNKGCHFTVKDMNTGILYLVTALLHKPSIKSLFSNIISK